jgi:hypothetical protein
MLKNGNRAVLLPAAPAADPLPAGTPWPAVILARVVTYLAWGLGVGLATAAHVAAIALLMRFFGLG